MTLPQSRPQLDALRPYKAVPDVGARFNLSANEACLGPSPAALAAATASLQSVDRYPDGGAEALRKIAASDEYKDNGYESEGSDID